MVFQVAQSNQVGGRLLQDGAIVANNPASIALLECRQLWPSYPLHCLVSLGSGRSTALEEEGDGKAPSAKEFGIKVTEKYKLLSRKPNILS